MGGNLPLFLGKEKKGLAEGPRRGSKGKKGRRGGRKINYWEILTHEIGFVTRGGRGGTYGREGGLKRRLPLLLLLSTDGSSPRRGVMRNLPIASPPSSSFFSFSIEVPAMTKPSSDLILFFFPVSSQSHSKDVTIDGRKEKSKSGRNGEKKREEEEEEEKKQIPRFFRFAQNAETFFPTGAQSLFSSVPIGGGGGEKKENPPTQKSRN